jgi:hypothetical protein
LILGEEKGPAVDQIVSKDAVLFTGDQWFESVFLQRAVCLSSELRTLKAKGAAFAAVYTWEWDVRRDALALSWGLLGRFSQSGIDAVPLRKAQLITNDAQNAAMVTA